MRVEKFATGILGTNTYIVINEETKKAVVIDPAAYPKKMRLFVQEEGIEIEAILLTHGHFDHIMGIDAILEEFKVPVYVHENDAEMMINPQLNLSNVYTSGYVFRGSNLLRGRETLTFAGAEFKVIHTPGHTSGGCSYYVESDGILFSGDTLFYASIGRTDFETSSMSDMVRSIREKLFELPDETIVYPGHMGATQIGREKKINPYV